MTCDFVLLSTRQSRHHAVVSIPLTSSSAIRFWINKAIRESRYLTSFSNTKFFFDCEEIFALRSRRTFWAVGDRLAACIPSVDQDLYLWQDHLQSPNPSHLQTWTCTAWSWNGASTGGPTFLHRGTTWYSGARLVGRRKRRLLKPAKGSEASRSWARLTVREGCCES